MALADAKLPAFVIIPFVGDTRFLDAVGEHALDEQPVHGRRVVFKRVDPPGDQPERRLGDQF